MGVVRRASCFGSECWGGKGGSLSAPVNGKNLLVRGPCRCRFPSLAAQLCGPNNSQHTPLPQPGACASVNQAHLGCNNNRQLLLPAYGDAPDCAVNMKLREIPPSRRQFWKETQAEQFAQKVIDQNQDYGKRDLPGNEVVVLALNEIAAEKGRMYFYFLPSRRAYDKTKQEGRLPAQRQAPTPR